MLHKHNWVKIKETYAPPYYWKWAEITSTYLPSYEKSQSGVTTVLWECSICSKLRWKEMLGKPVEEIKPENANSTLADGYKLIKVDVNS